MNRNSQIKWTVFCASFFLLLGMGGAAPGPFIVPGEADGPPDSTGVTQTLLSLIEIHEKTKITAEDYQSTSLAQIITFGTPAGYRIKLRYLEFGFSLVEALKVAREPELKRRLIELVQWSRRKKVRAEAIRTLAEFYDPSHVKYLKSALVDGDVGIRFAAVEALQVWRQEGTLAMLKSAMERDWSPLMRVFAAQAVLSLGDKSGLSVLYKELKNESWVVRAMAARYLGDYAPPEDYQTLVRQMSRETKNDYVAAEISIAALKLISQKGDKVSYSPFAKGWKENDQVAYTLGKDNVIEVEPLVIIPPRLHIPESLRIAATINNRLMEIIKYNLDKPLDPVQAQDPILFELNSMLTPSGFALKTRYAELNYLVVEALGGTTDPLLRRELENLARDSTNPLVRATALLSMAYNRNDSDIFLVEEALRDKNANLRMGALEAIEVGRFTSLLPLVMSVAQEDPSPALQVYATQLLAKFGETMGRQLLLTRLSEPDWPTRAMTYWFLSRYGNEDDYDIILARLPLEQNPYVQAEICLGILRLAPLKE